MQYGQIVFLLFTTLVLYYAALIVLDIQKARAAQAAEQEDNAEEDIDISDEAQTFKAVKVNRDEPEKQQEISQEENTEASDQASQSDDTEAAGNEPEQHSESEKPFRRPGYREAVMTDGILVEDLLTEINRLTETGCCDLGALIFTCENAK